MNVPPSEFQEFLAEYNSLAFPGQKVLQTDFFCQDDNRWQAVFLLRQEKQILADLEGHILCRYDQITPLFEPPAARSTAMAVQDLSEQLSGLRSRVPREDYEKAQRALEALAHPTYPFAPAYLVKEAGLMGVVDPLGQCIVPMEYANIETFAFSHPGNASVFLCYRGKHQLNSLDVFDMSGNCIFRQIGSLHPREETLLTPISAASPQRKLKSLWVVRQDIDHPFPEDPEFQLVREVPRRYTRKELLGLGFSEGVPWRHCPKGETPPPEALLPLAAAIGQQAGRSAQEVLSRLDDYRRFRQERIPPAQRLQTVTKDTPVDKLGLSIRAHHCLVRNGLQTVADVLVLSEEAATRLRRCTPEILQEIMLLRKYLQQ